jgi:GNAT superfamily N-acetyltransferase
MPIYLRKATHADIPAIEALIARSARGLSLEDYRPEQIESALRGAFGVDTQLLTDGTYFLALDGPDLALGGAEPGATRAEAGSCAGGGGAATASTLIGCGGTAAAGTLVGCGGWSYRATLFGSDARRDRDSSELDPRTHPAKIRAFFVDPSAARRGIASLLLARCESEARARGFARTELMATLPGVKFYSRRGYVGREQIRYDTGCGEFIEFLPMTKALAALPEVPGAPLPADLAAAFLAVAAAAIPSDPTAALTAGGPRDATAAGG